MKIYAMLAVLVACISAPVYAETSEKTLTIAADQWCPINCDPAGTELGIGIELAKKIYEPLGYRVNYVVVPWARALSEVMEGKVDAVVGANSTDEPRLIFPKIALYGITDDFFVLKENTLKYSSVESLKGQRIGIIKDYGYDDTVMAFLTKQSIVPGAVQEVTGEDALSQNIQKLLAKRIDVILETRPVMEYTLSKQKLTDKIRWIGGISQGNVFLAFSPKLEGSSVLAKQFDEGMARLKKSGELAPLYTRYGLKYESK